MNLRNVLRVYSLMRQFDDDESALLETLRSLSDPERELLVESLSPSQKKAGKKAASKSPGKSARASSLQSALTNRLGANGDDRRREPAVGGFADDTDGARCQFTRADNKPCHLLPDHNIHHLESAAEYHPFVPPAQSVASSSSASNATTSSTASSATEKGGATGAHRAVAGE